MSIIGVIFVPMKIISYTVRGLGGFEKRSEIRRLVSIKKLVVLCLQESKLNVVDELSIKAIWGSSPSGFSFQPSPGAPGGLLSLPHVLVIRGRVLQTRKGFVIANVYAPCDTTSKQVLWDRLLHLVANDGGVNLCLCGDFNSVRTF